MSANSEKKFRIRAFTCMGNAGLTKVPSFKVSNQIEILNRKDYAQIRDIEKQMGIFVPVAGDDATCRVLAGNYIYFDSSYTLEAGNKNSDDNIGLTHARSAARRIKDTLTALSLTRYKSLIYAIAEEDFRLHSLPVTEKYTYQIHILVNSLQTDWQMSYKFSAPAFIPINDKRILEITEHDAECYAVQKCFQELSSNLSMPVYMAVHLWRMLTEINPTTWENAMMRFLLSITALERMYIRCDERAYLWDEVPAERLGSVCGDLYFWQDETVQQWQELRRDVAHRAGFTKEGKPNLDPSRSRLQAEYSLWHSIRSRLLADSDESIWKEMDH